MGEQRDWLLVGSPDAGQIGRALHKTPHEIAVIATHQKFNYGTIIENIDGGHLLKCLKRTIFQSVRDTITENSAPASKAVRGEP